MKHFIFYLLFLIIGIYVGTKITPLKNQAKDSVIPKQLFELRQSGYKYINPLLDCMENHSSFQAITRLEQNINQYLEEQKNSGQIISAAVYFRDLNNGPWFGINEKEKYISASLVKLPILITYYKLAQTNQEILTKEVVFKKTNSNLSNSSQNIPSEAQPIEGKKYTVDDLIQKMIVYSDNDIANFLLFNIEAKYFLETYSDLGLKFELSQDQENYISVVDYAAFLRILYNASYLNRQYSEKTLKLLTKIKYQDGLVAGLPKKIPVAHKFGERSFLNTGVKQLHDCGIIYYPGKPYLLCVMTRGDSFDKLTPVIQKISQIVYNYVSRD